MLELGRLALNIGRRATYSNLTQDETPLTCGHAAATGTAIGGEQQQQTGSHKPSGRRPRIAKGKDEKEEKSV